MDMRSNFAVIVPYILYFSQRYKSSNHERVCGIFHQLWLFLGVIMPILGVVSLLLATYFYGFFLGPRGPLVLPLVGPVRPTCANNLDNLFTGIYAS